MTAAPQPPQAGEVKLPFDPEMIAFVSVVVVDGCAVLTVYGTGAAYDEASKMVQYYGQMRNKNEAQDEREGP